MKYVAESHNTADPSAYLAEEGEAVGRLQASGLVERVLVKTDWSGAVLIMEAPDRETARAAVEDLPLARRGMTSFTLIEVMDQTAALPASAP